MDAFSAFELLLRLMYGAAVPEAAAGDIMLLIHTYTAADMYGVVPRCSDVLVEALVRSLDAADDFIDIDVIKAIYSMPSFDNREDLKTACQLKVSSAKVSFFIE